MYMLEGEGGAAGEWWMVNMRLDASANSSSRADPGISSPGSHKAMSHTTCIVYEDNIIIDTI